VLYKVKFKIRTEPFLQAILPVIEVAGKDFQEYDPSEDDISQLRRITLNVRKRKITASSSIGPVAVTAKISGHNLTNMGYECNEVGKLTIEPGYLWAVLKNFRSLGRVVVFSKCKDRVTFKPEAYKYTSREFPEFKHHIRSTEISDSKMIAYLDRRTFCAGMRKVLFALGNKADNETYQHLIVQISKNRLRFIAGNGELFAVCDLYCAVKLSKRKMEIVFERETIRSVLKSLLSMGGDKIEISYRKNPESKMYPRQIMFRQGGTILSIYTHVCADKYPILDRYLSYDYKYKFQMRLDDWTYFTEGKESKFSIEGFPITKLEVDFIEGELLIKHGHNLTSQTVVPFVYDSNIRYIDTKSVKSDGLSLTCRSEHIVHMVENRKANEVVSIEFGIDSQVLDKSKADIIEDKILVTYPARKIKARGTKEQFFLLFPRFDTLDL
jgi:hypothetical protein